MIFNQLKFIEQLYIASSVITSIGSLALGIIVFLKNTKRKVNFVYLFTSLSVFIWSFALIICHLSPNINNALFWNRILHFGSIFIPITFFHFVVELLGVYKEKGRILWFGYFIALCFCLILFTDLFIKGLQPKFDFRIWPVPGVTYPFFMLYHNFYAIFSLYIVYVYFNKSTGIFREQLKWILIGVSIAFAGGGTNYLYFYNIHFPPIGNIFVFSYIFILAYAIIKYRLMDIKVVITRATIFLIVYSLILGVPFWFGFRILGDGLWVLPMSLMGIFATLGPFIYFFIQKRTEDGILKEQRSYQSALRQASAGMGRIKDLNKLLHMIVYVLTRTVRLEHSVVYIYDDLSKAYKLGAFKHRNSVVDFCESIVDGHSIVVYLTKNHLPIIFEEVRQKSQDTQDSQLVNIKIIMQEIDAALIVPIYIDNKLIAFVGLGKKESGKPYSEDDLAVFSILSNQAALAIENAQFYEDMKATQEQLFQAEKMATIGIMADGLSHQINNRFHAMGFISGDALDTIKINKNLEMSDKTKEIMNELERALIRIQENVTQGGEVVQGLLKYTRKGEQGLSSVDVDVVISSSYEMAQFKIKTHQMTLARNYDKALLPKVKGNSTQLQEVFFNLIDNAYDAMMQRKNDLREPDYHPILTIHAKANGNILEMIFEDNGAGVKEEDVQKLFTPFFTTKLSSKKGTGLGLYVIRKIIEDNHQGKVEFSSKFMVGTQMKIYLPIFKD